MFEQLDTLYGKLQSVRLLSPESLRRLSEDFMIDYTYNSNAIEGNTLTLDETAEAPLRSHRSQGRLLLC